MGGKLVLVALVLFSFLGINLVEATRVLEDKKQASAPSDEEQIGNNEDADESEGAITPSTIFAEEGPVGGPVSPDMFKEIANHNHHKPDLPFQFNSASALESLPSTIVAIFLTLSFFHF